MVNADYSITSDELKRLAELTGLEVEEAIEEPDDSLPEFEFHYDDRIDVDALLHDMGQAVFSDDPDSFAKFVSENRQLIRTAAPLDPRVSETLVYGYKMGVKMGSAACMNDLGALYYMGELVEQDFQKAADLYEMAMDRGCLQSVINLGYIWEYGRTGERDYERAYHYFALAAALVDSCEAVYKLGDMYARGQGVERDVAKAYQLWSRSLELTENIVELAQPAARIAQLLISDECAAAHVQPDALRALSLFQQAEIGLRIDIDNGQVYYKKRLQEVIEGQERARVMLGHGSESSSVSWD